MSQRVKLLLAETTASMMLRGLFLYLRTIWVYFPMRNVIWAASKAYLWMSPLSCSSLWILRQNLSLLASYLMGFIVFGATNYSCSKYILGLVDVAMDLISEVPYLLMAISSVGKAFAALRPLPRYRPRFWPFHVPSKLVAIRSQVICCARLRIMNSTVFPESINSLIIL